ncbi:hypothetical protein SLA2020_324500 [Shorea laevis]
MIVPIDNHPLFSKVNHMHVNTMLIELSMRAINTPGISKRVRIPQTLKFKAFVRSQHPTVAMAKIFGKTVEKPDIRKLKLPSGTNFNNSSTIEVRDEEKNTTWSFQCIQLAGQSYLGGKGWESFAKGIKPGNTIEVYKEADHYKTGAPPYKIVVR